jgi:DNA-directed RNA polymerase specialized sigma24 family protein
MRHDATATVTAPVRKTEVVPGLFVYPVSDARFRLAVEASYSESEGQPVADEAMLAAVAALLRPSYPLATVHARATPGPHGETIFWDAFRDDTVLDDELLRRARSGLSEAVGQLYDRHHALVCGVALRTVVDRADASDAVVDAFRRLLAEDDGDLTVRVRLARAARDAALARGALRSTSDGDLGRPSDAQRTVVYLAHTHRLMASEIAAVLRLDIGDVRRLANHGLAALARSSGIDRRGELRVEIDPPGR